MNLIDYIRKDAKAGTPGPWESDHSTVLTSPGETPVALETPVAFCVVVGVRSMEDAFGNARRIARVPAMEAALLAAEELAAASAEYFENLEEGDFISTTREERYFDALAAYRKATETMK